MPATDRPTRLYGLQGRLETSYGTPETAFDQFDVLLCQDRPDIQFEFDAIERNLALPWMGNSPQIPATRRARVKMTTELVGSGVADTPPAWGKWLRACGFTETIVAGTCVKYTLLNSGMEGMTLRFYKSGVRYISTGARGNVGLTPDAYGIPMLNFEFLGFNTLADETALPSLNLSKFQIPQAVNTENSGSFIMGGTLNASGSVTGGTAIPMKSLSWDLGNKLAHRKLVDGEKISISDRNVKGRAVVDLTATQEVTWRNEIAAITTGAMSFTHGATAGKRVTVHAPFAQRENPQAVEDDGFLLMGVDLRAMPSNTGAPELTIVSW